MQETKTKLRLGMVGGGHGAFIGAVHRMAARLDDEFELIAAALSADPARAIASGQALGLAPERIYESYTQMLEHEAARADRIDAVAIVTPNHLHFPVAKLALELGFHVICDKPMTVTRAEAETLVALQAKTGLVFCLTHNYTGYPMVRQARAMVEEGALGPLRVVQVEYPQDWLTEESLQTSGLAQRPRPSRRRWQHRRYRHPCLPTRLLRHPIKAPGAARGTLHLRPRPQTRRQCLHAPALRRRRARHVWASQIAPGNENALRLRVYGEKAGLEWAQETPNTLIFSPFGAPKQILTRNGPGTDPAARRVTRVPAGHPEGYVEAFTTIHRNRPRHPRLPNRRNPRPGYPLPNRNRRPPRHPLHPSRPHILRHQQLDRDLIRGWGV